MNISDTNMNRNQRFHEYIGRDVMGLNKQTFHGRCKKKHNQDHADVDVDVDVLCQYIKIKLRNH